MYNTSGKEGQGEKSNPLVWLKPVDRSDMMVVCVCVYGHNYTYICVCLLELTWEVPDLRGLTVLLWWRCCIGLKPISDATSSAA